MDFSVLPYDVKKYEILKYLNSFDINVFRHAINPYVPLLPVEEYGIDVIYDYDSNFIEWVIKSNLLSGNEYGFYELISKHDLLMVVKGFHECPHSSVDIEKIMIYFMPNIIQAPDSNPKKPSNVIPDDQDDETLFFDLIDRYVASGRAAKRNRKSNIKYDESSLMYCIENEILSDDTIFAFCREAINRGNVSIASHLVNNFLLPNFENLLHTCDKDLKKVVISILTSGNGDLLEMYIKYKQILVQDNYILLRTLEHMAYDVLVESNWKDQGYDLEEILMLQKTIPVDEIMVMPSPHLTLFTKYIDLKNQTPPPKSVLETTNSKLFKDGYEAGRKAGYKEGYEAACQEYIAKPRGHLKSHADRVKEQCEHADEINNVGDEEPDAIINRKPVSSNPYSDEFLELTDPELIGLYGDEDALSKEELLAFSYSPD